LFFVYFTCWIFCIEQEGKAAGSPGVDGAGAIKVYGQKPSSARDPVDAFKSFRISQDDPCHKVLPAALKKYKINDDWRQYALFICYGSTGMLLSTRVLVGNSWCCLFEEKLWHMDLSI